MDSAIMLTAAVAGVVLLSVLKTFSRKKILVLAVLFPVVLFSIGFSLRLSGVKEKTDMGFFFTEFSFLFVYLLLALSLLLGQVRYWKR